MQQAEVLRLRKVHLVPVDFPEFFSLIHGGERILLDDGKIELMVTQVIGWGNLGCCEIRGQINFP